MKPRLDQLVVERGLAPSRDAAKRLILAGKIEVDGQIADKPGKPVAEGARVELRGPSMPYVSRGGQKLEGAVKQLGFALPPGCLALDIGASTGGFTDYLLQHGASRVVAVDVGYGQIHEKLRSDSRVTLIERTNARYLTLDAIGGEPADLIVIDVSFISLTLILAACAPLLKPGSSVIALIKPQFEAGRGQVGSGGVVREASVHRAVLERILEYAAEHAWSARGLTVSPILGADGNVEFFIWLSMPAEGAPAETAKIDIEQVLTEAYNLRAGRGPASP